MRNLYFMMALLAVTQLSLAEGRFCNYPEEECWPCLCDGNVCSVCGDYGPQECVYTVGGEDANYPAFPPYKYIAKIPEENVKVCLCGSIQPAILEIIFGTTGSVDYWYRCDEQGEPSGGAYDGPHFIG